MSIPTFDLFCAALGDSPKPKFAVSKCRFEYLNKAALSLFGAQSEEQLLGRPMVERIHPIDRRAVSEWITHLDEKQIPIPHRHRYLRLDGMTIHVEASAVPIRFGSEPGGFVCLRELRKARRGERGRERDRRILVEDGPDVAHCLSLERYFCADRDALGGRAIRAQEEHELARCAVAGDFAAQQQLLAQSMDLVVRIARSHAEFGLPLPDLIRQGNTALIGALRTFDPDRPIAFSVYAGWQVIQGIEWAPAQSHSPARLPGEVLRQANACIRARRYLALNGYAQSGAEDIAYVVGSPVGPVRRALDLDRRLADLG